MYTHFSKNRFFWFKIENLKGGGGVWWMGPFFIHCDVWKRKKYCIFRCEIVHHETILLWLWMKYLINHNFTVKNDSQSWKQKFLFKKYFTSIERPPDILLSSETPYIGFPLWLFFFFSSSFCFQQSKHKTSIYLSIYTSSPPFQKTPQIGNKSFLFYLFSPWKKLIE